MTMATAFQILSPSAALLRDQIDESMTTEAIQWLPLLISAHARAKYSPVLCACDRALIVVSRRCSTLFVSPRRLNNVATVSLEGTGHPLSTVVASWLSFVSVGPSPSLTLLIVASGDFCCVGWHPLQLCDLLFLYPCLRQDLPT